MTSRTFFYCTLCFVAALVVASAASSGAAGDAASNVQTPLAAQALSAPAPESARLIALVFGIVAILLTYQQAWRNLRRRDR